MSLDTLIKNISLRARWRCKLRKTANTEQKFSTIDHSLKPPTITEAVIAASSLLRIQQTESQRYY